MSLDQDASGKLALTFTALEKVTILQSYIKTMKPELSLRPLSRGEKETETEASRLIEHIEEALNAVAIRSNDDEPLDAIADRIERAARDLSAGLRELAEQRRIAQSAAE